MDKQKRSAINGQTFTGDLVMSFSHHEANRPIQSNRNDSAEIEKLMKRFNEQVEKIEKREYTEGRLGPHDEGVVAFAMAADKKHNRIICDFGKSVTWFAMTTTEANQLINLLKEKIGELGEPVTITL